MHIINVGVDYRVTPLEMREKLTFSEAASIRAMITLNKEAHVLENIILSTCNRTEIFAVVDDKEAGKQDIIKFFADWFQTDCSEFMDYLRFLSDEEEAIRHAFKLATGLDSMVLGETQILGQVRKAFLKGQDLKTTGKLFNELFKRVITFAKRAHKNTAIGEQAVSISYMAVELSKKVLGDIRGKHAVILGAGEMGELSLKNLQGAGVSDITVVNRSFQRAEQLAEQFQAIAATMTELAEVLAQTDIVISSTGAPDVILTKEQLVSVQQKRNNKPLILIDIAVPRDIDEAAGELDNIYLYNTDDLQYVVDENMESRQEAAIMIESQLEEELSSFKDWLNMLDVVPIIKALREKSICIQERTLESIYRKIPDLDDREVKVLQKHMKSIVHQLLEQPIKQVKLMGSKKQSEAAKEQFTTIFGLEDQLLDDK
ncbi:MAG TPA: glutamyl-tRNA reductase [Virgibacillus sp.]|nr:glutamyl-tRNA reductase [Virgibacillus sp.]HLR68546.1 glutamyl-tRNA reductase [Virgibacillus sp.]